MGFTELDYKKIEKCKIISFDIFDTVLTRIYTNPKDVFKLVDIYSFESGYMKKGEFYSSRIESELKLRREGCFIKEVTLDDIYREIGRKEGINSRNLKDLKSHELKIERESYVANSFLLEMSEQLRRLGKRVIFISDMYLDKNFLYDTLNELGFKCDYSDLFISSEVGRLKATGELFSYVLEALKISPSDIIHIGDNLKSDFENPIKLGMRAIHYKSLMPSRYEKTFENDFQKDVVLFSSLIKSTRLRNPFFEDEHNKNIWNVSSAVIAPLLYSFVVWTIKQALENKLENIYYCSRDGQILYKIAKLVVEKYNIKINVKYLFVSRQSLLLPAIEKLNDESFEWILARTQILSPRIILKRVGIDIDDVLCTLEKYNYKNFDENLDEVKILGFKKVLIELEEKIIVNSRKQNDNICGYFEQEGLFSSTFALVDIGWSGTIQRSISRIMEKRGYSHSIVGLYFGLKRRKKNKDSDRLLSWFTDYKSPCNLDRKTYIIPLSELFTCADHGGVVYHYFDNKKLKYTAKLSNIINEKAKDWGIDIQHDAVIHFTNLANETFDNLFDIPKYLLERNFEMFHCHPTYEEAKCYGSFYDAEDQNESYYFRIASPYTIIDRIKKKLGFNFKHHHNEWVEGSLALTRGKKNGC